MAIKKVMMPTFQVGTIVTLKVSFMGEPIGTKCFVYENYGTDGGLSIISENGKDIGGFAYDEQHYLEYWNDSGKYYRFTNVMQLHDDFRKGLFKEFFILPKYQKRNDN